LTIHILLIGPLPPPMGGTTRHFQTLVQDLEAHEGFALRVVNTSRGELHARRSRNLLVALRTLGATLAGVWRADVVSYHASNRGMVAFGPLVVALCRLARRPVVLRVFGGGFGDYFARQGRFLRAAIRRFILGADAVLLQTRRAVAQLAPHARGEVVWFSTYITAPQPPAGRTGDREACTRFVFLGHLWRTKGIETLVEAAGRLPEGCSIDVYGPTDEYSAADIDSRGQGRVRYRGILSHAEVEERLWDYDCLVLPTFHENEGYPGVIAEAFAHGLPVIATRWLAIPEIVDDGCGLLVEPRDTDDFVRAVARMHADPGLWRRLGEGARARAPQFDHARWAQVFEDLCGRLVRGAAGLRA
jgi:glycosyltransferase involved in cell wall biosynthesis